MKKKNRKFRIREKDVMNSLKVITAAGGQNSVTQMIGNLFVTSKNETTNSPIHEFKVLHKDQRAF